MAFEINGKMVSRLITHNGSFHSDDVFATALLLGMNSTDTGTGFENIAEYMEHYYGSADGGIVKPEQVILVGGCDLSIERVSSEQADAILADAAQNPEHDNFIMYDVGNGTYDHHRAPRETRENGIPYCAFGKLWRDLGGEIVRMIEGNPIQVEDFDRTFVQPICLNDNQGIPNILSLTIKYLNTTNTYDDEEQLGAFAEAVDYAQATLLTWFNNMRSEAAAGIHDIIDRFSGVIEDGIGNQFMLIYDHEVNPHYASKFYPNVKAVIYPHSRGGWAIESLSDTEIGKSIINRWRAPKSFWGKTDPNDEQLTAIGAKFCHATGFIMSFIEKEDALDFAREVCGPDAILRMI